MLFFSCLQASSSHSSYKSSSLPKLNSILHQDSSNDDIQSQSGAVGSGRGLMQSPSAGHSGHSSIRSNTPGGMPAVNIKQELSDSHNTNVPHDQKPFAIAADFTVSVFV